MPSNPGYQVHQSSYIDEGVEIGEGTCIWHFCHVLSGVKIGKQCRIGQNVVLGPRVNIGHNVKIQNNVSVYEGVTLCDDVFCGPSVVFTNVQTPRSAYPRNKSEDFAQTIVRTGASIGANATIVCGNTIGEHALIGAGSVVTRDIPPHGLAFGNPAHLRGWACECGEILVFSEQKATCNNCQRNYQTVNDERISLIQEPVTSGTTL